MPHFIRALLPIALVALLVWLLQPMIATRIESLRGATVIGTVTGHTTSRSMSNHAHHWQYPIVRYQLPANWPVAAGTTQNYNVPWTSSSAHYMPGAEIQLKLPRDGAFEPLIYSFEGFWIAPLATLMLGSAIIMIFAFGLSAPTAQELRYLHRERAKKHKRSRKLAAVDDANKAVETPPAKPKLIPTWLKFASTVAPIFSPLLLIVTVPALLMAAPFIIIADAIRTIILRLWHVVKPKDDDQSEERIGFLGLLVNLVQSASLIGLMSGFAIGCGFATFHLADKITGQLSWSLAPVNTVRTMLWLPQDIDDAFCAAGKRQDGYARNWLLKHGARPNVVCESPPEALPERE